jgi:DNA-binding SARP family transcriptional activator
MRFGVLGPVEICDGDEHLPVGGPQQRALLAVLLVNANQVVSVDRLVDYLWGDDPPATARGLLQGCVAGLRRALRAAGAPEAGRLQTAAPGYLLRVEPGEFDLDEFERLARAAGAAGDPEQAHALLVAALSRWRGPPLADIELDGLNGVRTRLADRRLAVLEQRIELDLRLGRRTTLIPELQNLVRDYPLRERLWGQLMQALHQADRRADALRAYRDLRRSLVEQLGVEPGPTLQRLHRAILAGEVPSPAPPAPEGHTDRVPAQLPAAPSAFTGRASHLKRIDELVSEPHHGPRVAVISGMAGVGKTALAIHWGHRVRERFADGQLYVNLRGYASSTPMRPIEALAGFLHALQVPAERIPTDLDQATGQYRSLLASRRMLIVLDNAYSLEQVRPLVPGADGCLVLVTSREQLGGLVAIEGAAHVRLDVLDRGEARDLLGRLLGEQRVEAEPRAAEELARLCGYLPLALRVAAADLTVHPRLGIGQLAARLTTGDRLAELTVDQDEQAAVSAAFDQSYAALPADARRLFRLLGLAPGPYTAVDGAAALAGTARSDTARLLNRLASAHLLDRPAPDAYTLHDLLRGYASRRSHEEDPAEDRRAALDRLFAWYLTGADAAARLLYPEALRLPRPDPSGAGFEDRSEALAWLEAERSNLVAAIRHATEHGTHPAAYHLADALQGFYQMRSYYIEWLAVAGAQLAAARADGNLLAEVAAERNLGRVHMHQHRHQDAIEHYQRALELGERAGWVEAQATTLNGLGIVYRHLQRLPEAMDCFHRALALNQRSGQLDRQAPILVNLAAMSSELGQLRQAADFAEHALRIYSGLGSPRGETISLGVLGEIYQLLGRLDEARDNLSRAMALAQEIGEMSQQSARQHALAAVHRDAGRYAEALVLAEAALASARELEPPFQGYAFTTLGTIYHLLGEDAQAIDHHEQAMRTADGVEFRITAAALIGIAAGRRQLGQLEQATGAAGQALAIAGERGYRLEEGRALTVLATIDLVAGRVGEAVDHARRAVAIQQETGHRLGEARALRALAGALERSGETGAAADHRRRASAILTELGSPEAVTPAAG